MPGVIVLARAVAAAWRAPAAAGGENAVAHPGVLAAMLDAPRVRRAEPPLASLSRLLAFASRARVALGEGPPIALMPVVHLDVRGVPQDARLRLAHAHAEGVLRADVVVRTRSLRGPRFGLLVVTARGTAIDDALEHDARFERVATGAERHARLCAVEPADLGATLARLAPASEPAAPAVERDAA